MMAKFIPLTFLKDTASIVEFCQECGEQIGGAKKCDKCGSEVPEGKKFCPDCGNAM